MLPHPRSIRKRYRGKAFDSHSYPGRELREQNRKREGETHTYNVFRICSDFLRLSIRAINDEFDERLINKELLKYYKENLPYNTLF